MVGPVGRHHRPVDFVGEAAIVIEPFRHVLGLRAHLGDQLAVVAHFDLAEIFGVLFDQAADAAHHLAACGG